MSNPSVLRWIIDVEPIWPLPTPLTALIGHALSQDWAPAEVVQHAMRYLGAEEQAKVLRFHFAKDARLALASCLIKHRVVADICKVPWSEAVVGEDGHRKPCYNPKQHEEAPVEFNVSHHGTLVALAACEGSATKVGIDVMSIDWERQYAAVMKHGFASWIKTYDAAFSTLEIQNMIDFVPTQFRDERSRIMAKIRHFYAHWCLKEAYVKMTGDALLAPWLKDLEFRQVHTPFSAKELGIRGDWGETSRGTEVWFEGKRTERVKIEIQAYQDDYLIAIAASDRSADLTPYKFLDVHRDVLP